MLSHVKVMNDAVEKAGFFFIDEASNTSGKFAPVAPYHIYQQFAVNGYTPNTVLLLAHDVVKHKDEYAETFNHPNWNDTNIIMDNSLVELGNAVDADMVFEAADTVCADIVVLPDVMGSGAYTVESTMAAYDSWKWKFRDYQLMPLIHGSDIQDWFYCAEMLAKHCQTSWIGIPRKAEGIIDPNTEKVYSRSDLLEFLKMTHPTQLVHLFGFSDSIWEDLKAAKHPRVKSIDSAVPLRLETTMVLSEDAGPRGDWWETVKFDPEMIDRCQKINSLISA